jgi:hypothetical protein
LRRFLAQRTSWSVCHEFGYPHSLLSRIQKELAEITLDPPSNCRCVNGLSSLGSGRALKLLINDENDH